MTSEREALFQALTIGDLTLKNRIVMAPMTRSFSPDGVPGADVAAYYARRAADGTGLILTEGVAIDHPAAVGEAGLKEIDIPQLHGDAALNGWRDLFSAVHGAGGTIIPQLWHQGVLRVKGTGRHPEAETISPSGLWGPLGRQCSINPSVIPADGQRGAPATDAEIADVIVAYARSAANAMACGADGIAIHGAHGYLPDNFLWAETNQRTDRWGGSRAQRSQFAADVVAAIRTAIGPNKPIFFRFSQWKQQDFKARLAETPQELEEILTPLADAGVDVFDASVRYFNRAEFAGSDMNLAGWAKKVTGKMGMTVGGIGINKGLYDTKEGLAATDNTALLLQRFNRGEFDLCAVGRAMIGDPAFAEKLRKGEAQLPFDPEHLKALV